MSPAILQRLALFLQVSKGVQEGCRQILLQLTSRMAVAIDLSEILPECRAADMSHNASTCNLRQLLSPQPVWVEDALAASEAIIAKLLSFEPRDMKLDEGASSQESNPSSYCF